MCASSPSEADLALARRHRHTATPTTPTKTAAPRPAPSAMYRMDEVAGLPPLMGAGVDERVASAVPEPDAVMVAVCVAPDADADGVPDGVCVGVPDDDGVCDEVGDDDGVCVPVAVCVAAGVGCTGPGSPPVHGASVYAFGSSVDVFVGQSVRRNVGPDLKYAVVGAATSSSHAHTQQPQPRHVVLAPALCSCHTGGDVPGTAVTASTHTVMVHSGCFTGDTK